MYIRHQFWSLQMAKYWKNCLAIWSHCFPAPPPLQKSFYLWISITFPVFGRPLRRYCKVLLPYYSLWLPYYSLMNIHYFSSLWETSQTLFWAIFGLIDLDNFELTGIKEFTRFSGLLGPMLSKTDFAETQFCCEITARFWCMILVSVCTCNFALSIWSYPNATYITDTNTYCYELT